MCRDSSRITPQLLPTLYTFGPAPDELKAQGIHGTEYIDGAHMTARLAPPWNAHTGTYKPETPISAFTDVIRSYAREAKGMLILDSEQFDRPFSVPQRKTILMECAAAARDEAPHIIRACYTGPPSPFSWDDVIVAHKDRNHAIHQWMKDNKDFYANLNYVLIPAYLIVQGSEKRDLEAFAAWRSLCEQHMPEIRPLWAVWGRYNSGTYPYASDTMQQRLAKVATQYDGDAAMWQWDQRQATLLKTLLARMG